MTIGLAVAACFEYERDICFRLTVDNQPFPPVDARVRRAGVRAKEDTVVPATFKTPTPRRCLHITFRLSFVDSIDSMAPKAHLNVPGVRLPTRKERKSRLRLLDSDDDDYRKGRRVPPDL